MYRLSLTRFAAAGSPFTTTLGPAGVGAGTFTVTGTNSAGKWNCTRANSLA